MHVIQENRFYCCIKGFKSISAIYVQGAMFCLYHKTNFVCVCVVMVLESSQWECPGSYVQHHRAPAAEEARSKVWKCLGERGEYSCHLFSYTLHKQHKKNLGSDNRPWECRKSEFIFLGCCIASVCFQFILNLAKSMSARSLNLLARQTRPLGKHDAQTQCWHKTKKPDISKNNMFMIWYFV